MSDRDTLADTSLPTVLYPSFSASAARCSSLSSVAGMAMATRGWSSCMSVGVEAMPQDV